MKLSTHYKIYHKDGKEVSLDGGLTFKKVTADVFNKIVKRFIDSYDFVNLNTS